MKFNPFILFCLLLGYALPGGAAETLQVQLILSDNSPLYQSFLVNFRQNLTPQIRLEVVERAEAFEIRPADLIVTVGVKAASWVAGKTRFPMLAAMVPSRFSLPESALRTQPFSALYLDQPWHRQVHFLRAALPERRRVGVLISAESRADMAGLRSDLSQHGGTLDDRTLRSNTGLFTELDDLLTDNDVLLAVPDGGIYNSNTIRNILLASYHRGIPLVGFSAAYVKAGALCAIFSTPEELAVQAGEMTQVFARTGRLPDAQYPTRYAVALNAEVARTLGITLPSAEALRTQIDKAAGAAR